MKNKNEKTAPKLPRFKAPKNLMTRIYFSKKERAKFRQSLKKLVNID